MYESGNLYDNRIALNLKGLEAAHTNTRERYKYSKTHRYRRMLLKVALGGILH